MKLVLKNKNSIFIIETDDMLFCKSEGNYVTLVLKDRKIVIYTTLDKLIELLPKKNFCRCHNSYIVNLNEISELNLKIKTIILKNKTILPISIRRKRKLLSSLVDKNGK